MAIVRENDKNNKKDTYAYAIRILQNIDNVLYGL